jgi:hypothetical protein
MLSFTFSAPLSNTCTSRAECSGLVRDVIRWYGSSFPYRQAKLKACSTPAEISSNTPTPAVNSAARAAQAYFHGCRHDVTWSNWDADAYFNATWLPGVHTGGADCERMTRFGPPWHPCPERAVSTHSTPFPPRARCKLGVPPPRGGSHRRLYEGEGQFAALGDGGKTLCEAEGLLRGPGCLVVSVGINANTEFEEALHRAHPHCEIDGYDGTLSEAKAARARQRVPSLRLHAQNFGAELAANYSGRSVRLLKIDCDGCEFDAVPPWIKSVCTDQIVVEVHRTLRHKPMHRVRLIHDLMMALSPLYSVFYLEPNAQFPWLNTEYSLMRSTPCPRDESK